MRDIVTGRDLDDALLTGWKEPYPKTNLGGARLQSCGEAYRTQHGFQPLRFAAGLERGFFAQRNTLKEHAFSAAVITNSTALAAEVLATKHQPRHVSQPKDTLEHLIRPYATR